MAPLLTHPVVSAQQQQRWQISLFVLQYKGKGEGMSDEGEVIL